MTNPLAQSETWDTVADAYVAELLPMFEEFARAALRSVPPVGKVLDVACGPGSLARQAVAHGAQVTALDFSSTMLGLLRTLPGGDRVETRLGDAAALPFGDEEFDAAYLMFALMFVPDRAAVLAELHRVVRPDGGVVIATWVPVEEDPGLAQLYGTLGALLDQPANRSWVWSTPEECRAELAAAGFADVEVQRKNHVWRHESAGEAIRFAATTAAPHGPVEIGMRALLTTGRRG
jgi:SAM-dependent methyltransferase